MSPTFPGLSEADFDAYLPARATSNAYVRPRLPVKEKLLTLGRGLAARARAAGLALDVHASDERPSVWNKKSVTEQWVFLWRDRGEREALERAAGSDKPLGASLLDPTPYYQHAFLALYLDATKFEVTLRVHAGAWADVKNLRQRLESAAGREAVSAALAALPEGFALGVTAGDSVPAANADGAKVAELLERAVAGGAWLSLGWAVTRDQAVAQAADLGSAIDGAFDALMPAYRLFAWRREEDLAHVAEDLERERVAKQAQLAEAAARQAEWVAQHEADIARRREQAVVEARERALALEPARPLAVHAAVAAAIPESSREPQSLRREARGGEREGRGGERNAPASRPTVHRDAPATGATPNNARAPERKDRPAPPPAKPAAPPRPMRWMESDDPITLGGRVRIRSGPFAGKEGTVVELDPRGVAKVSLGLMSARVEATQLITLAERPA